MQIIRLRQIIKHQTPTRREITDEYTLLNDSSRSEGFIILQAYGYKPNLHIYDNDGTELALYSNGWVIAYLGSQSDPLSKELLADISSHRKYVQWISLPPDRPWEANTARVIRFVYTDGAGASTIQSRTIFNTPLFKISQLVPPNATYMTHYTIIPPEEFEFTVGLHEASELVPDGKVPLDGSRHYHETIGEEILEFAIPTSNQTISFECTYGIMPNGEEARLFTYFFTGLYISSLLSLGSLAYLGLHLPVSSDAALSSAYQSLGTAIFAICLVFIGVVTNPLTHRTKLWMSIPMLIAAVVVVMAAALKG